MEDMRYEMMMDNGDAQEDLARRGRHDTPADWAWESLVEEGAKCECCGSKDIENVDHECVYSFVSDDFEHFENEYRFYVDCMDCGESFTMFCEVYNQKVTLMGYYEG